MIRKMRGRFERIIVGDARSYHRARKEMKPIRPLLPILLTGAVAFTATACTLLTTAAWLGANPPPASGPSAERLREIRADKEAAAWAARDTATRETAP